MENTLKYEDHMKAQSKVKFYLAYDLQHNEPFGALSVSDVVGTFLWALSIKIAADSIKIEIKQYMLKTQ
jgi:hypothetical protein